MLQVSAAHCYLTYPFVLSWSMLESMATGCLVVAGDTAPVREVLTHGRNGISTPALDVQALRDPVVNALQSSSNASQRSDAQKTVKAGYARASGVEAFANCLQSQRHHRSERSSLSPAGGPKSNMQDQESIYAY